MKHFKILNSKQKKVILKLVQQQWSSDFDFSGYAFLQTKADKVYIVNRDFACLDLKDLRIDSLGLYLGQILNSEFRLSIEGSQLVGPMAKKNVLEIDKDQLKKWFLGDDLPLQTKNKGFLLVRFNDDFVGSGKVKDDSLLNFVPKARKGEII